VPHTIYSGRMLCGCQQPVLSRRHFASLLKCGDLFYDYSSKQTTSSPWTAAQSESRANQEAIAYSVFDGDRRRDKLTRRWPG
jgi:hypothetical protein